MNELIMQQSYEIYHQAELEYPPFATVLMFSGGDDSLTAWHVANALGIKIDYILHTNTRTGITATTDYVRRVAMDSGICYIEADAKAKYERYVLQKGFFGRREIAHLYSYHVLKSEQFSNGISKIRQNKRNRNILLLNGGRRQESKKRETTMMNPIKAVRRNIWVNIINEWSKMDCANFLHENHVQRNPVSEILHRSGECMCGTMQSLEARKETAYWFPEWGKWIDELEGRVQQNGFWWKWGEDIPQSFAAMKNGQMFLPTFQPMCVGCTGRQNE